MPDAPPADDAATLLAAWDDFLDQLRAAGHAIAGPGGATDPVDLAEGFRYLTRLLSASSEMTMEHGDARHPAFTRLMSESRKFFGDNPDTVYDHAALRGDCAYVVRGNRGTCHYLSLCVYGHEPSGATRIVGSINDEEMDIADDGSFSIVLAAEAPTDGTGSWLPTAPDVDALVVRQYFLDRDTEVPATYSIEPLEHTGPPPPLAVASVARRLRRVAEFVHGGAAISAALAAQLAAGEPNAFTVTSAANAAAFYPTPDNQYVAGWYRLAEDEALLITGTPPDARYWGVLLMSRWMESLDYGHHQVLLNQRQIPLEPDGTFRIVVAAHDPGTGAWLDTAGHREGYVMFRWLRGEAAALPECTVVPLVAP